MSHPVEGKTALPVAAMDEFLDHHWDHDMPIPHMAELYMYCFGPRSSENDVHKDLYL